MSPLTVDTRPEGDSLEADLVTVAVPEDADLTALALPFGEEVNDRLRREAKAIAFKGSLGSTARVSGAGAMRWVALVGTGQGERDADWRRVGSAVVKLAGSVKARNAVVLGVTARDPARFLAEGAALAAWTFDTYRTPDPERGDDLHPGRLTVIGGDDVKAGVALASELVPAVLLARQVANEPPNVCTPTWLADKAREIATRHDLGCTILDEQDIHEKGLRLLEAVGRGSAEESRLIHLVWTPEGEVRHTIAFVGKGLTFDSGGYSLKPPNGQMNMHLDMGGAAAVLGAAEAIGRLRPAGVKVHFVVPAAENLVSGNAYKVMDIIEAYNGTRVEIHNTDAEGRLVLADAIAWIAEQGPDEIIDLATLTGSCVVALGNETAGLFTDHDALATGLLGAADAADEALWRLPLVDRMRKQIDSERADVKNIGSRWGGAITAAMFLQRFAGEVPWAHIDVAGPAMTDEPWEYIPRGGTGFGVLLLAEYVRRRATA
ncbi:MAG: leucyl aminopeptidase [Deltaproteobacteria bacterium]|nr:MAG: leucyl aminopeptidase [Deltaproteobacteria bacterium]